MAPAPAPGRMNRAQKNRAPIAEGPAGNWDGGRAVSDSHEKT